MNERLKEFARLAEARAHAAPPVASGAIAPGLAEPLEVQGHGFRGDASRIQKLCFEQNLVSALQGTLDAAATA